MLNQSSVCTTTLCKDGRADVQAMWYTLNYLRENYTDFEYSRFQPTCQSIQQELNAVDSWYADLIPFNPTCCTIENIGLEAQAITSQMLTSVGAVGVPAPPPSTDWSTLVFVGGAILLLVVYSPQIKKVAGF